MKTRITELENQIRYHADLYNNGDSEISDAEYDALVEELKSLDPKNAVFAEVGASPSYGKKINHHTIMGSLEKVKTFSDLMKWHKQYEHGLLAMPKIDGLSLRLTYQNGRLVEAASRGDGTTGMDVLDNVQHITDIPQQIDASYSGEIRGEVYLKRSVFKSNAYHADKANPRNAAAGALMQKNAVETGKALLSFFAYDELNQHHETHHDMLSFLLKLGFRVPPSNQWTVPEESEAWIYDFEHNKRVTLDYDIDGLVFVVNDRATQTEAGWNGRYPRARIAYKFAPETQIAKILAVDWQVGRTGKLTPMARISPTKLAGSTISNITLHNCADMQVKGVQINDDVVICKGGDIIPVVMKVHKVNPDSTPIVLPEVCPSCGMDVNMSDTGVNLECKNELCPARMQERILHYLRTLGVDNVGDGTVAKFVTSGLVKDLPDLYFLDHEAVTQLLGSPKMAEKVMVGILSVNQIPLATFLASLGIHGLGNTTGKTIAKEFRTLDAVQEAKLLNLAGLPDIGMKTAESIVLGLARMKDCIAKLGACLDVLPVEVKEGNLKGKVFCMTGALSKPRNDIKADIVNAGGDTKDSVVKGLHYLVTDDPNSGSSKNQKAQKLGVQVIDEMTLYKMIKGELQ